jgi:hypothetical protein
VVWHSERSFCRSYRKRYLQGRATQPHCSLRGRRVQFGQIFYCGVLKYAPTVAVVLFVGWLGLNTIFHCVIKSNDTLMCHL